VFVLRMGDGTQAWHTQFDQYTASGVMVSGGVVFVFLVPPSHGLVPCLMACTPQIAALDGATGSQDWRQDALGGQLLAQAIPIAS
jgi:hypothetical protein